MVAKREYSAGGIVLRVVAEATGATPLPTYEVAVIKPRQRNVVALPKGHIDPGETAPQAAAREVREETGLTARLDRRLGDVKYVYKFQGKTIFKVVSFFLFHHVSGTIDEITEAMRVEVDRAFWLPLLEAPRKLTFPGEREMATRAIRALSGPPPSP